MAYNTPFKSCDNKVIKHVYRIKGTQEVNRYNLIEARRQHFVFVLLSFIVRLIAFFLFIKQIEKPHAHTLSFVVGMCVGRLCVCINYFILDGRCCGCCFFFLFSVRRDAVKNKIIPTKTCKRLSIDLSILRFAIDDAERIVALFSISCNRIPVLLYLVTLIIIQKQKCVIKVFVPSYFRIQYHITRHKLLQMFRFGFSKWCVFYCRK